MAANDDQVRRGKFLTVMLAASAFVFAVSLNWMAGVHQILPLWYRLWLLSNYIAAVPVWFGIWKGRRAAAYVLLGLQGVHIPFYVIMMKSIGYSELFMVGPITVLTLWFWAIKRKWYLFH